MFYDKYKEIFDKCEELFNLKNQDYGLSWTIMRPSSLTDQIWIKAKRIRAIQENKAIAVEGENIDDAFIAMINYSIMGIMQYSNDNINEENVKSLYSIIKSDTTELMMKKNKDYGSAWQDMRISSIVDIILMKLLRVKQIEDNNGITSVSEPIVSSYFDIINYSIFCLIILNM